MTIVNALTVDVEEYFQVSAFEGYVERSQWDSFPLRVVENTQRVLALLDSYNVKGTFFVLGWVAKRCPALVRLIRDCGHEIACHGYGHELIYKIGPERFREDVRRAKSLLEDVAGQKVLGYRAPSYSITRNSIWALDILVEEGFLYDSSIFPVYHDLYGMPDAPRFPHLVQVKSGSITEFPLSTYPVRLAGKEYRLPIAGGGYLRLFPAELLRRGIVSINKRENKPAVLYFHPWELDPGQPRIRAGLKSRFRHYVNLSQTEAKLQHLLDTVPFGTMAEVLVGHSGLSAAGTDNGAQKGVQG